MSNNQFQKLDAGIRLEPQVNEPATGLDGEAYFNSTLGQFRGYRNGAWQNLGSGGFGVNFIQNFDGESSTAGWALYNDGATPIPVDGTGGSATALTFAVTRNPTHVLYQMGSFDLTKSAVNAEGQGVSYDFTIDQGYRGYSMMVQGIYKGSANFGYGAGTFASPSDIGIFLYNVDTAQLVPMSTNYLDGSGSFLAVFPTDSTSVNYRLIFHVATTNALAWDFYFDSVVVGPVQTVKGAVITDWVDSGNINFTDTGGTATLATVTQENSVKCRRVGNIAEIEYTYEAASSTGANNGSGDFLLKLPNGLSIDNNLVDFSTASDPAFSIATTTKSFLPISGHITNTNSNRGPIEAAIAYDNTHFRLAATQVFSNLNIWSASIFAVTNNNTSFKFIVRVPIAGWSSNMILSSETSSQKVMTKANMTNVTSVGTNVAIGNWDTPVIDTTNSFNKTTGQFRVPVSGDYEVHAILESSSSITATALGIVVDGTIMARSVEASSSDGYIGVKTLLPNLRVGQVIEIRNTGTSFSTNGLTVANYLEIYKLSTPQTVAFDGNKVAYIKDVRPNGTTTSASTATYSTRTLNTTNDPYNIVSLNSNQFVLQPGQYTIDAEAVVNGNAAGGNFKLRVQNITDSSTVSLSLGITTTSTSGNVSVQLGEEFMIPSAKTFELQSICSNTSCSQGNPVSLGDDEVYTIVKIVKKT